MTTNKCVHVRRFDDAYFLEPEAVASASKRDAPGVVNTNVSAARGGPGGDKEDGGDIARITAMAAAVPGLPLDGADGGTSYGGEGIASREGATATPEGKASSPKQGDGDDGRLKGVETRGAVARPTDATAVDGERNSGDDVGNGIGGVEDQHTRGCGIVCQGKGVDELGGPDSTPGDVGAAGAPPPAAWTFSKRPRKE